MDYYKEVSKLRDQYGPEIVQIAENTLETEFGENGRDSLLSGDENMFYELRENCREHIGLIVEQLAEGLCDLQYDEAIIELRATADILERMIKHGP